ncbi:hypothetical protein CQA38_05700 [Campylobacter sp. MIT 12-5580]|nr:hypothetical protein CQA38_05700 [Campylobacter sp. MIT 12-5580]
MKELFDLYSVFEGFNSFENKGDLYENINFNYLQNYTSIASNFKLSAKSELALKILAKNSRKKYSINKKLGHFKATAALKELLELGFVSFEKSREERFFSPKGQKLKKYLRGYVIQDKILFCSHFMRFFYYFLKPNEELILNAEFDLVLELIKKDFEHYQSLCFELLSKEFLQKKLDLAEISSFWHRDLELDLYYEDVNLCFVGEVKYKNKKVCKNVLNLLKFKASNLDIKPNFYVLFSKSGFSSELLKLKESDLLLFDLNDFKELLKEQ